LDPTLRVESDVERAVDKEASRLGGVVHDHGQLSGSVAVARPFRRAHHEPPVQALVAREQPIERRAVSLDQSRVPYTMELPQRVEVVVLDGLVDG
jgi:hypothetical protein